MVKTFRIGLEEWGEFKRLARRLEKKPTALVRELIESFIEENKEGGKKR